MYLINKINNLRNATIKITFHFFKTLALKVFGFLSPENQFMGPTHLLNSDRKYCSTALKSWCPVGIPHDFTCSQSSRVQILPTLILKYVIFGKLLLTLLRFILPICTIGLIIIIDRFVVRNEEDYPGEMFSAVPGI